MLLIFAEKIVVINRQARPVYKSEVKVALMFFFRTGVVSFNQNFSNQPMKRFLSLSKKSEKWSVGHRNLDEDEKHKEKVHEEKNPKQKLSSNLLNFDHKMKYDITLDTMCSCFRWLLFIYCPSFLVVSFFFRLFFLTKVHIDCKHQLHKILANLFIVTKLSGFIRKIPLRFDRIKSQI